MIVSRMDIIATKDTDIVFVLLWVQSKRRPIKRIMSLVSTAHRLQQRRPYLKTAAQSTKEIAGMVKLLA